MAEKIKFRLTAARVGVSAALLALIGGVVDRLPSGPSDVRITRASAPGKFLKLGGIQGNVKSALLKLEDKWIKIDGALNTVIHKLDVKYLKITQANSEFLKLHSADVKFHKIGLAEAKLLKIDAANAEFLKIKAAGAEFLKIKSAGTEFLKIDAARRQFEQGQGSVVSGATTVQLNGSGALLQSPDGLITVSVQPTPDFVNVVIHNSSSAPLGYVAEQDYENPNAQTNATTSGRLSAGKDTTVLSAAVGGPLQLHLQTFPSGKIPSVLTLTVSVEQTSGNEFEAVGQLLSGTPSSP
jgi:hypothetical protein